MNMSLQKRLILILNSRIYEKQCYLHEIFLMHQNQLIVILQFLYWNSSSSTPTNKLFLINAFKHVIHPTVFVFQSAYQLK